MTKDEWESLVTSPGWPRLKQYLRDFRERLKENIADGGLKGEKLTEAILQCGLLKDLAEMDLPTIENFYRTEATYTDEQQNEQ